MPLRLAVLVFVREEAREEANTGRLSPCPCYGRKFLEMLVRHGEDEAAQVQEEYREASGARGAACFADAVQAIATEEPNSSARGRHWLVWRRKVALRAVVETAAGSGAAPWKSIELEIVRVLEAINELRVRPDYELHRLTERSPEFFDETVGRHLESLETELAALQSEAEKLAGEIVELTGEGDGLGVASGRKPGLGGDGMR